MQDGFFLHLLLLPIKIILIKEVHIFEINLSNKQRWQQDQPEFDSVELDFCWQYRYSRIEDHE